MRLLSFVAVVAVLSASLAARADTLVDTLVVTGNGNTFTFTLPSTPTVYTYDLGEFFTTLPTTSSNSAIPELGFGSTTYGSDLGLIGIPGGAASFGGIFSGPQLYTGSVTAPTLLTGTFSLFEIDTGNYGESYTATITSTPEPSSIALLGTGMLGVAGVVRKRFA